MVKLQKMVRRLVKQFKYGQKGFTLIELLVVVGILGVLAAVAIPNVAKFIHHGQTEAAATELDNVQTAVTAYMAMNAGAAPAAVADLVPDYLMKLPVGAYTIHADGSVTSP